MDLSIIYIINKKENLNNLEKIKNIVKNFKYELILVNNILNYDLRNLYNQDKNHIRIINLSKKYNYIMSLMAGITNSRGNNIISLRNNEALNVKDLSNYISIILEKKQDQLIVHNEQEKKFRQNSFNVISMWLLNNEVKDALIYLYNNKYNIDYKEIGFNTKDIVNDSIELIEEENNNYFLIKNKIGYDISIL